MKYAAIKAAMYFFGAALGFTLFIGITVGGDTDVSDAQFFGVVFLLSALVAGFIFFQELYDNYKSQREAEKKSEDPATP